MWEEIKRRAKGIKRPFICMRGFNDVVSVVEKERGRSRSKEWNKIECYQDMIKKSLLNEVSFKGQRFTWFEGKGMGVN